MKFKEGKLVVSKEVAKVLEDRLKAVNNGLIDKFDIARTAYVNGYSLERKVINADNFNFEELLMALHIGHITEEPKYKKEDLQFRMNIKDKYDNELTVINQVGYELYSVTMIENGFVYTVMIDEQELLNNLNSGDWILQ